MMMWLDWIVLEEESKLPVFRLMFESILFKNDP